MAEFVADSPVVARPFCPGCEPDTDPTREILDTRWCDAHAPVRGGAEDEHVRSEAYLSGSSEAGGDENRRWCEFIHRGSSARSGRARSELVEPGPGAF